MKVMFDLSAFSDLVERQALDHRVATGKRAITYASFTFLEELAALRKKDERKFTAILDQYSSRTWGRIVLPWNELVRREAETGHPVTAVNAVLPSEDYHGAINLVREGATVVDVIDHEVAERKQRYQDDMNKAAESVKDVLSARGYSTSEIKKGFAEWLSAVPQYLQDWGGIFHRASTDFTKLPHVAAYFGYFFVKHYQSMNQGRNHCGSDLYDEGYYIESTTLGNLVTCDRDLYRTAMLVPENAIRVHDGRMWTSSSAAG